MRALHFGLLPFLAWVWMTPALAVGPQKEETFPSPLALLDHVLPKKVSMLKTGKSRRAEVETALGGSGESTGTDKKVVYYQLGESSRDTVVQYRGDTLDALAISGISNGPEFSAFRNWATAKDLKDFETAAKQAAAGPESHRQWTLPLSKWGLELRFFADSPHRLQAVVLRPPSRPPSEEARTR